MQKVKRELEVFVGDQRPEFQQVTKYFSLWFDRKLSCKHLEEVKAKTPLRISLIQHLARTSFCSRTLCTSLVQKLKHQKGSCCPQQRTLDHYWHPVTHTCILPVAWLETAWQETGVRVSRTHLFAATHSWPYTWCWKGTSSSVAMDPPGPPLHWSWMFQSFQGDVKSDRPCNIREGGTWAGCRPHFPLSPKQTTLRAGLFDTRLDIW